MIHLNKIVEYIHDTSKSLNISPSDVTYSQFRSELKQRGIVFSNNDAVILGKAGGFNTIKWAHCPKVLGDIDALDTAKVLLKAQAKVNVDSLKNHVEDKMFLDSLDSLLHKRLGGKIVPSGYSLNKSRAPIHREVNICLSDLHIGAHLTKDEGFMAYGHTEEARRVAQVVKQVIEYKLQYRNESLLRVHLLGDIIQGKLHDVQSGDTQTEQIVTAIDILSQAIAVLAKHYPKVVVHCITGNHGRNQVRHRVLAVQGKYDSHETTIYHALRIAASNLKNVEFDIPKKAYVTFDSFGMKVFATHGDTIFDVGQMWNTINVNTLERQINRINASQPKQEEYKLFFVGHIHMGSLVHLPNHVKLITNGALIPSDDYAQSIGMFENTCGQTLWESTPGHIVGDYRFIEVEGADQDATLDKIIKPFKGL